MKAFINHLIPKIQKYSQNLDNLTFLTNHHWVSLSEIDLSKTVYIFRSNKLLLIAKDGIVKKGTWEYLGNESLLFETDTQTLLLKHFFVDDDILMLKLDGSEDYVIFVNETKFGKEINSVSDIFSFLENKYVSQQFNNDSHEATEASSIRDVKVPSFQEFIPITAYNIFFGSYDKIRIRFSDGIEGEINRGHSTGKYFYYDSVSGRQYANDKLVCISLLYRNLKFHMSRGESI